jgi:hypothetical protein
MARIGPVLRKTITSLILLLSLVLVQSASAHPDSDLISAHWDARHGASYQVIFLPHTGIVPLQCAGVPFKMDHFMESVANTDRSIPEIHVNSHKLLRFPRFIQVFIMAHECAHAYFDTDNEEVADCFAALVGLEQGWMVQSDFAITFETFSKMAADYNHRPGLSRWLTIVRNVDKKVQMGKRSVQCDQGVTSS